MRIVSFLYLQNSLQPFLERNGSEIPLALDVGSNMSNTDRHNGQPLPTIIVGGGGGKLSGGKHIELPGPTPLANLHLTILGKAGVEQKSFGDSTGTIAGV
jgi:hypothetical protein